MTNSVDIDPQCRFCSIKVNNLYPKLNNLSSQLMEYQYIDEFHFYFAKTVNELVNKTKTTETILFHDMLKDDPLENYLKQTYTTNNLRKNYKYFVKSTLENRKTSKYEPHIMNISFTKIFNNRKQKKDKNNSKVLKDQESDTTQKEKAKYDKGLNILYKLDEASVDLNTFETKIHNLYYPSFSSDSKFRRKRNHSMFQLASLLQRSSFQTNSAVFINDSIFSSKNYSNIFFLMKNSSYLENSVWDFSKSNCFENESEIVSKPNFINTEDAFYKKKSAKKLILRTENSYYYDEEKESKILKKSFLNFSKSISQIIDSSQKDTTQRILNVDCLSNEELTYKINEKYKTMPIQISSKNNKKMGLPEKFIVNFKKNVKKDIEKKINMKSNVKSFKNIAPKTQRSTGTAGGTANKEATLTSNSQQNRSKKIDNNQQSPDFKHNRNTKFFGVSYPNTHSKGKKVRKQQDHITSELLKKTIVKSIKTQSEFSPHSIAVPIGLQKCSWSPKNSKLKYSILNTARHESPKFTRKGKHTMATKKSLTPTRHGFGKKKTPGIFLNTESQAKIIEYPLKSKMVTDVSIKRKNVQNYNRLSEENFYLKSTSNKDIKLSNNSQASGSQKDLGIITMLGYSPKIHPNSVKKSGKKKVLFMDRRRKIQMPLTTGEKSSKILQDLDSLTSFKKKLTKHETNNTLLSFRNRKNKDQNDDNFNTSNPKYNNIIFNGFNNNNIIKKFNISQSNNNITNINTSKIDSVAPSNNRLHFGSDHTASLTDLKAETVRTAHEESNNTAQNNNQNLNIQNFLSIHNNFINPSNTARKNTSQTTSRRRNTSSTNNKPIPEGSNHININSGQVNKELHQSTTIKKPKKNVAKENICNILRANDFVPKFTPVRDCTNRTSSSIGGKKMNVCNSSSRENLKTNQKRKLELNLKIPLQRIKTDLLVSPIDAYNKAPKSDRKTTNTKIDRYFNTNYTINNCNSTNLNIKNLNYNNISSMGNSMRLDKCSEKSTSRNNTYAKIPDRKKLKTSHNILGAFRVKKTNSFAANKDNSTQPEKKNACKPCLSLATENYQSWKRMKKLNSASNINEESSFNANINSSKELSTKRSVSKELSKKNSSQKNATSLKLKDSYLCGINLKKQKHQDQKNLKQTLFNEIKSSKPKLCGSLKDTKEQFIKNK